MQLATPLCLSLLTGLAASLAASAAGTQGTPAGPGGASASGAQPSGSSIAASVGAKVIFSNVTGSASADVPGYPGLHFKGGTATTLIERCYGSPNGNWIITAQTDNPTTMDEVLISNYVVRLFEGDFIPAVGANAGLIDRHCNINDVGQFVWSTNTNGPTTTDECIFSYSYATGLGVVAQEGGSVPAIPGGTYGFALENPVILRDGTFGLSGDGFSGSVPGNQDELLILGNTVLLQQGISIPAGQIGAEIVQNVRQDTFFATPDGSRYAVMCDLSGPTAMNTVVIVDGSVVLQEGVSAVTVLDPNIIGNGGLLEPSLDAGGNWYARGSNAVSGNDWVVRNGVLLAETGASVIGGAEVWDDTTYAAGFFLHVGNGVGDYIVGGSTDGPINANHVMVLNGTTVVCRRNDPVDLDGNGFFDDNTRIDRFGGFVEDYGFLSDSGEFYFVATLRTDAGSSKGMAFLKIDLDANTQNYCSAGPTSLGEPALIRSSGSTSVSADDLVLMVSPVPPSSVGLFFYGAAQTSVPFGNGTLCVAAGAIGLFRLGGHATSSGFLEEQLDIANPLASAGQITAGSTWNFQGWFRDTAAGGAGFDLSDALQVTFTP